MRAIALAIVLAGMVIAEAIRPDAIGDLATRFGAGVLVAFVICVLAGV